MLVDVNLSKKKFILFVTYKIKNIILKLLTYKKGLGK